MFTRKQERNLMLWDLITVMLALFGIVIFTAIFIVVENEMRFALVLELVFAVYAFARAAKNLEDYYKKYKVEKNIRKKLKLEVA